MCAPLAQRTQNVGFSIRKLLSPSSSIHSRPGASVGPGPDTSIQHGKGGNNESPEHFSSTNQDKSMFVLAHQPTFAPGFFTNPQYKAHRCIP